MKERETTSESNYGKNNILVSQINFNFKKKIYHKSNQTDCNKKLIPVTKKKKAYSFALWLWLTVQHIENVKTYEN